MRRRQIVIVLAIIIFALFTITLLRIPPEARPNEAAPPPAAVPETPDTPKPPPEPIIWEDPPEIHGGPKPKAARSTEAHPIQFLVGDAQREFDETRAKQSTSLEAAVKEYRRRYQMPPPPNFDKWFAFAKKNGVQLVDEFDTIYDLVTPFWGLKPKTIRSRAREALGYDNALIGVAIRDHKVTHVEGGQEWQQEATKGMIEKFVEFLPDMDLAFNIHDEPRVMVPHDDLARLVDKAKQVNMPAANAVTAPANDFSPRAPELGDGNVFDETKLSRFNVFAHQATWTNSRMSCPPDSPARVLDEDDRSDDRSRYGYSELGFVYNATAMSDICLTPSLSSTYGFFERPNAYNIVHDLFPVFSQSKISSYADLIYPSPWYWFDRVAYDEEKDRPWAEKEDRLYWRGSTTGGFSRNGGWRRHHRQHFVQKINARDNAKIMVDEAAAGASAEGQTPTPNWQPREVPRGEHRDIIDIHFSHVGQCDQGDCDAQIGFFDVVDHVEQQDAWAYKHLLDIDGNAFSGRFYAFLQSRSMTFKLAVFREWHYEWLRPWIHYVPLSIQGDDWLEAVRFFAAEDAGKAEAARIAEASREWANKVVRKEDMEAWFFRLLLEYGRVIDDNRETIGYDPASAGRKLDTTKNS